MDENMKNRLTLILAILTIIFFMGTIRSCASSKRLKDTLTELDKEKTASWESEQKMNEIKKEKTSLEKELEVLRLENETNKKALLQEQLVSQSLKDELQKVTKLKDTLEDDLKDALTKEKKTKVKN